MNWWMIKNDNWIEFEDLKVMNELKNEYYMIDLIERFFFDIILYNQLIKKIIWIRWWYYMIDWKRK